LRGASATGRSVATRTVIEAIIETAKRASSSMNTVGALCYGIMTCVRDGYPDDTFPANAVRSDRQETGEFARFVGFAGRCGGEGDYSLAEIFGVDSLPALAISMEREEQYQR
jgi:hypothetical protein